MGLITRLVLGSLLILFSLALPIAGAAVADKPVHKDYDVPAGDAVSTLKVFVEQSGEQVAFLVDTVRGVRTKAVAGEFTAREALNRMLSGTDLYAMQDEKSGALTVRRVSSPNAERAAATVPAARQIRVQEGDEVMTLRTFEVTGSRLPLNTGERPMQPVQTYTADDIERTGATSLGQLFQYIPAVTSYTTGIGTETVTSTIASGLGAGQTQSRTSAQLRGGSQNETLLLVDGRRVPLTALRNAGGNGYDLGAIPLAAIERVEVLLDGASAIYGADAVNGVINIILKKSYSGTELQLSYDNTFDKDAAVMTASLTHGFASGKWSGILTLSGSENNIMLLTDRYLTSSFDRTLFGGLTNQSQPTLYVEGTGSLNRASGNLPSTTTPRVSIPEGYSGGPITIADYAAAPAPVGGITPGRQSAVSYSRDRSAYLRIAYEFSEHLTLTSTARYGTRNFHDNGSWRRVENVTIPAGYAGNPFGVPVRLSKTFYDLPPIVNGSETENQEFTVTASGKLPGDWRYEAGVSFVEGISNMLPPVLDGAGGRFGGQVAPASQFTARLNAEIAAGRNPILVYDSNSASPNAPGALDIFWVGLTQTRLNDRVRTLTYSGQASGRLFTLPAGDVQAVIGAEVRQEDVAFPGSVGGQVWPVIPERDITAIFAEVRVPLLSKEQDIPGIERLELNLAGRTEDYSDFGRATTPRYGLAWRPVRSVLLRGSYGEGFLAPQLYRTAQESAPVTLSPAIVGIIYAGQVDISRGNAPITGPLVQISGGNPDLQPQLSENVTFGIVVDVPKIKGLSLSFDYYDNQFTDAFGGISSMMDRQRFAPETIFRGDKLPGDPADWLGPITGFDGRTINISSSRSAGYSYGVRYQRNTEWGDFSLHLSGEKTQLREERILPESDLTATVDKRYVPQRVTLNAAWSRGAWEAGVTGVYGGKYWTDSNNANLSPSRNTDDVMRWDITAAYDFGRRPGLGAGDNAWWKRALHETKLRLTVINLFDTEPPLTVNGSFSSSVIDMRLRRYIIDVTKRF